MVQNQPSSNVQKELILRNHECSIRTDPRKLTKISVSKIDTLVWESYHTIL